MSILASILQKFLKFSNTCGGFFQGWTDCVPNFLGAHILPCQKENLLGLQIFSRIDKIMKMLQ